MDQKTLYWIISALLAVIIFFVQDLWRDVKTMKADIKKRTLILDCNRSHEELNNYLHQHAVGGVPAGEVVLKKGVTK